jgi:hypothetical protein
MLRTNLDMMIGDSTNETTIGGEAKVGVCVGQMR